MGLQVSSALRAPKPLRVGTVYPPVSHPVAATSVQSDLRVPVTTYHAYLGLAQTKQVIPHFSAPPKTSPTLARVLVPRFGYSKDADRGSQSIRQYGAQYNPEAKSISYTLFAPNAKSVELVKLRPLTSEELKAQIEFWKFPASHPEWWKDLAQQLEDRIIQTHPLVRDPVSPQNFTYVEEGVSSVEDSAQQLYMYRIQYLDDSKSKLVPDPYSRFQPEPSNVHGPSQVIDPKNYSWGEAEAKWQTPTDSRKFSSYRLHVGTFTPEGTFKSAIKKLDHLKEAGINMVELFPVQGFAGNRSWGYNTVNYYAPATPYGSPDELRDFVKACHEKGIAVIFDVVYNHVGTEGNYLNFFADQFTVQTDNKEWGAHLDWHKPEARVYALNNLAALVNEFHADGFRFDMASRMPRWVLAEMVDYVQGRLPAGHAEQLPNLMPFKRPQAVLFAETEQGNGHEVTDPRDIGGLGFWGQWFFSFHHMLRGLIDGRPHMDHPTDLNSLVRLLEGKYGEHRFYGLSTKVLFHTSHDEIGNHSGKRPDFSMLNLFPLVVPGIPLTLQGEEYQARTPWHYFGNNADRETIEGTLRGKGQFNLNPYQQTYLDPALFEASKLNWNELETPDQQRYFQLFKKLQSLRVSVPALWEGDLRPHGEVTLDKFHVDKGVLIIDRRGRENPNDRVVIFVNFSKNAYGPEAQLGLPEGETWQEIFNTTHDFQPNDTGAASNTVVSHPPFRGGYGPQDTKISLGPQSITIFRNGRSH